MGSRLLVVGNLLKVWLLLIAVCAVLGGIGWALDGYSLFSIFVFSGLLLGAGMWWYADRAVLGLVRARELPQGEAPGLHSTVERLAALAGVAKPRLYVMSDGLPRACSAGRGPRSSTIAVSKGLLQALPPAELEGVLAHELAHIRHRDVFVQSVAAVIAAVIVEASRIGGWFGRALLFVLGPVAAAFVHLLLSPKREFDADRGAAGICGSPHGLAAALIRLDQASELVEFQGSPVAEPLYTINPFEQKGLAALFVTHPPVAERVRRLRGLDSGEALQAA
ncbi:MAG TPA: M48 family metalloprotease [Gaiellaceae bacterium]